MKFNFYSYLLIQKKSLVVSITNANTVIIEILSQKSEKIHEQANTKSIVSTFKCMKFKR